MSRAMDDVVESVANMIRAGGDVSIKNTNGCHNCLKVKNSRGGSYCSSCRENTPDAHIVVVSTKRVFCVQ